MVFCLFLGREIASYTQIITVWGGFSWARRSVLLAEFGWIQAMPQYPFCGRHRGAGDFKHTFHQVMDLSTAREVSAIFWRPSSNGGGDGVGG